MRRDGGINIGLYLVLQQLASESGLITLLCKAFGGDIAALILDIALYGINGQSMSYQFFQSYARDHAIFSEFIPVDASIASALSREITEPEINLFRHLWARHVLDSAKDAELYCGAIRVHQEGALGVVLEEWKPAGEANDSVQRGVNLLVRQKDGLPVAYTMFPGEEPDITEETERTTFLQMLLNNRFPRTVAGGLGRKYTDPEIDGVRKRLHVARNCKPACSGRTRTTKSSQRWETIQNTLLPLEPFLAEECFESQIGMAEDAKALIWFVSAILTALLSQSIQKVGMRRKDGSLPDVWWIADRLGLVKAIIDRRTNRYWLPQDLPAFERELFRCIGISKEELQEYVESLETEIEAETDLDDDMDDEL